MGYHHTETALLGSGWSLCKLLEQYVGTLYPFVDMQSQAFKMNPNKDFFQWPSKHSLLTKLHNYLPRHEERMPFPDSRDGY